MTFVCNLNLSLSDRFGPVLTQIFSHKVENNETQKLKTLKVNSHDAVGQEACVQLRIRWINHISLLLAKLASMFVLY